MANEVEIVITGEDKTGAALASVRAGTRKFGADLRQTLGRAGQDAGKALGDGIVRGADTERRGRGIGARFAGGISGGLKRSAGLITDSLNSAFTGGLKGSLSSPVVGPIILAAMGSVAASVGPAVAALIGGGIVAGIGAGLAGIGTVALFHVEEIDKKWSKSEQKRVAESNKQAEKLRKQYQELGRDVINGLKAASQPLIPVLDTVRSVVRDVGKEFQPVIKSAMEIAKGPLQRFVKNLGVGFKELAPSLEPLMGAFGGLLDEIGPQLPGLFEHISSALIDLATTVNENRDVIGAMFVGLMQTLPLTIELISMLGGTFRDVMSFMTGAAHEFLGVMKGMLDVLAQIPGPWQDWARTASASIGETMGKVDAFKVQLDNFPKIVKLEGDIRDLDAKLASARSQLKDKNLTKTRRAKLQADIAQLLAAKRRAQAEINSLRGKTVTVFVKTEYQSDLSRQALRSAGRAHGGIIGALGVKRFAAGGISGAGSSTALVGEQGPELVRLPVGSSVTPAGQTRSMLSGGGFNSISMAFRAASGAGGGLSDVAGPLKEVAQALREVVSLRDGMDKLTGGIFGQTRALMGYEEAWDAARKSLKENGKTLNITKEKGRENRAALLGLAEAAHSVWFAMRDLNKPMSAILATVKEQRAEFIRMARSFGLTSAQARAMADRLGLVPSKVKGILTKEAKDTAYNKKIEKSGKASGGIAGGWTLVGERGAELVDLPWGSRVMPHGQSMSMLSGGGGGGGSLALEVRGGSGGDMERMFIQMIRRFVRVSGGGSVQTALGR